MKINQSIVLIFVVMIASTIARSIAVDDEENSLSPSLPRQQKIENQNDFVKIVKAPPARVSQSVGSSVELECEVVGSPIPMVQWVHGSGQYVNVSLISVFFFLFIFTDFFSVNSLMTLKQI